MNKIQAFENFLTSTTNIHIPLAPFIINLFLAAFLALILSYVYIKYGNSLSNREMFGRNFLLLTVTTMLIISIVKSSLALSLGLVGALSIVRFRAAIKEPEELAYLFLAIGIGLGFGADQVVITLTAFVFIMCMIIIRKKFSYNVKNNQNLYLTIYNKNPDKKELEQIIETLKEYCSVVNLKRFDETSENLEVSFLIEFHGIDQLKEVKYALQNLNNNLKISFLDNKGII